jgi:DNA repair photolyase
MELDAWLAKNLTSDETRKTYEYFMRPEPKDVRSDIMVDEETGLRYRLMAVGMTRNASEDNRQVRKVFLDPIPHIRLKNAKPLQGWYKSKIEKAGVRNRPCFTDAMLTEPYGGYCAVGCAFCYINSGVRGYRGSGLISVPMNYGEQVASMLSKMKTSAAGYFSSFTDPFLPLEDVYHNTQRGVEAFVQNGLPVFILSRKRYPEWAKQALMKNPHSYAQKSINHWDEKVWRKLSPGAATLEEHMEDIRDLRSRGVYVSIQLNPVLPGITSHEDVEKTMEMLAEAGANHVIIKFVEAGYSWAPAMVERVHKRFDRINPEGAKQFAELFCENIGGQRTIAEEYRMEAHPRYMKKATECGMTYAVCYEYKYERNQLGQIVNKTGISIGRDFITADQCHGQRVPMYSRRTLTEKFAPVPECPPVGCLHCADDNEGEAKCGSNLFGAAKALRGKDFKVSVWDKVEAPADPRKPKVEAPDLIGDMFGSE